MIDLSWSQEASRAHEARCRSLPLAIYGGSRERERKRRDRQPSISLRVRSHDSRSLRRGDCPAVIRIQPRSSLRTIAVRNTHTHTKTSVRCVLQNVCATGCHCPHALRCVARRDTHMKRSYRLATVVRSHDTLSSIIDSVIRLAFPDETLYRPRRRFSAWSVIFERRGTTLRELWRRR